MGYRAFDTGSERIWDAVNRGVRLHWIPAAAETNGNASANGRTSSTDTWRRQRRTTSDCALSQKRDIETYCPGDTRLKGRALYIGVFYSVQQVNGGCLVLVQVLFERAQTTGVICYFPIHMRSIHLLGS